jgi:ketosteroid isomerase-like protein
MVSADEGRPAASSSQVEQDLRRTNDEWAKALAQGDGAALDRIMANDFVFAYPFEGDDKGQFIADVVNGDITVESLETHNATIRVSGETGVVFGTESANWHYRGHDFSDSYRFVRVYARQQGQWQIVALHLCSPAHR